jgi:hypothetical protein
VTLRFDPLPLLVTSLRLSVDKKRHFQATKRLSSTKETHLVDPVSLLHVNKPHSQVNERLSRDSERHLQGNGRHRETTKRHPVTQVMLSVTTMTLPLDRRTT